MYAPGESVAASQIGGGSVSDGAPGAALLRSARFAAPHELPDLVRHHAAALGCHDAVAYLADLQQSTLVPFTGSRRLEPDVALTPLTIDATLAGRAFSHLAVLTQPIHAGRQRVWLPLVDGADRLGAFMVVLDADGDPTAGPLLDRLTDFCAVVAELLVTKTAYGDTLVQLRRTGDMRLAAELQWSLLPPLTFASRQVTVAAALEPAYEVAGDTADYAIDQSMARAAVFDGMGHGLTSAMLAAVAVSAYRNARRSKRPIAGTAAAIDEGILAGFGGHSYTTGVLIELDTDTGELHWLVAGHPLPLLLREGKLVKALTVPPTLPFGLTFPDFQRGTPVIGTEHLQPGDLVVLYSDGVVEARSPDGAFFGEQRLVDLIVRHLSAGLPAPEMLRRIIRALLAHQQGQLSDDATLLVLRWDGRDAALGSTGDQ